MVPGWWVAPAVDRPSQRRGFVLSVLEVQICSWNQPSCQLALTEQRRPMERGLPEAPAQFRSRSGIQQPQPYFLRSEARGPDQRRVLPFLLKIEVRPGLDQRFDEPQLLAFWQHAVEEHVRNVVEWMGSSAPILPPTDQLIGAYRSLCQCAAQGRSIAGYNGGFHVEMVLLIDFSAHTCRCYLYFASGSFFEGSLLGDAPLTSVPP